MTDQPFQPVTTDSTQGQTASQGGVFGGFVGVEEAPVSKIPDTSVLFGDSSATTISTEAITTPVVESPVVENPEIEIPVATEVTNFGDLNITQTESTISDAFTEASPIVEEIPVVEEIIPTMEEVPAIEATKEINFSPVVEEEVAIEPIVEEVVVEPIVEEVVVEPIVEEVSAVNESLSEEEIPMVSDIKAKYNELSNNIKTLIGANTGEQAIDIVGSNTDISHVEYTFTRDEDILEVTRTELNKQSNESTDNTIAFVSELEEGKIQVYLDDTLLFEEQDLQEDPKKKMQVMEKFNKFIFLTGEKIKDFEKVRKAQEAELQEKRRLQDIFRNF